MHMPIFSVDFSRPVSTKLSLSLRRRVVRLEIMRRTGAVDQARAAFDGVALPGRRHLGANLRVRHGLAFRTEPAPSSGSDRQVPPRGARPPATRIASSRGLALRLEIAALAAAQSRYRAGAGVSNSRPLRPSTTSSQDGWVDLLATPTIRSGSGRTSSGVIDKKVRQFHAALTTLEDAGLVDLPNRDKSTGIYEEFQLLDERGPRLTGPSLAYAVPRMNEAVLLLPSTLITQGWLHLLEDSELSLLLMVASGIGGLPNQGDKVAVPADIRLLHYGISRHAFGDAHVVLSKLGLLEVEEVGRNDVGQTIDYPTENAELHRLKLLPHGFLAEALPTTIDTFENELGRLP